MQNKRVEFIITLIKKRPDQYIRTVQIELNNKIYHIGLFKCEVCNKPITDKQYNFARCCASCDIKEGNPEWVIEKPESQEFENITELSDEEFTEKLADHIDMTSEELKEQSEEFTISPPWASEIEYDT